MRGWSMNDTACRICGRELNPIVRYCGRCHRLWGVVTDEIVLAVICLCILAATVFGDRMMHR
jgi:hypothetical protein